MSESPDVTPPVVPFAAPDVGEAEIDAVVEALRSGWLTTGPRAAAFETEFAEFLRTQAGAHAAGGAEAVVPDEVHAVALNSATAGLHLALEAIGVGPGDEVLVPTWTFTSTAEVVRYLGADPVIVDVTDDLLLDLDAARAALTPRTRAVMPVHLAGLPVDRAGVAALAADAGISVVEDAAHGFPALSSGIPIGLGASEAVVFSFYATKTMTTGEGGMVVTHDADLARRIRTMRLHGISRDVFDRYSTPGAGWAYEIVAPGYKYNLTDPAAAMGRVQLRRAVAMRDRRRAIADRYDEAFADLPVELPPREHREDDLHAWHLYVLRLGEDAPLDREAFVARLGEEGIGASVHFIPLHRHPYWRKTYGLDAAAYPVAERHFPHVVSLPLSSGLTDAQVERVVDVVRRTLGGR
ncbi:DegT/DnrJ/EryC1/StrS family aminotransferase [Mobilicoccus pelagius]|uniref:Putative aminotransferase n=1 Tax=Mobilicoccus pelagius NBRC 104925 TaxID=1089455 RepID=H5UMV1_9MICO|nr:DegT/DnrJ/EryC1/StrS aminotransferase family protein [Mobilicoccus pelagius]GAB47059.1 putative aminotransferase [Mobilicoccus pelagius NBRC 104925]